MRKGKDEFDQLLNTLNHDVRASIANIVGLCKLLENSSIYTREFKNACELLQLGLFAFDTELREIDKRNKKT